MIVFHYLRLYLAWTGSNVAAMPLEGLAALAFGLVFRKRLTRAARWLRGHLTRETHAALADLRREMAEIRSTAEKARTAAAAAHRISADTHRHLTGGEHPDAPRRDA